MSAGCDSASVTDLALKFGAVAHDARLVAGLLRRIEGQGGCHALVSEALSLVADIEGTAEAGMQVLPDPAGGAWPQ